MQMHIMSSSLAYCRPSWSCDDVLSVNFSLPWNKVKRLRRTFGNSFNKRNVSHKSRIQASGKFLGSGSDRKGDKDKSKYHPFEDISDSETIEEKEGRLSPAETCRTIIEMNNKATLMFSGSLNGGDMHENIFWSDLPYLTDEHGNVYFQVSKDEDIMQSLTSDNNHVHVLIGLDTAEMMDDMEFSDPTGIEFGMEDFEVEFDEEDGDFDEEEEEEEVDEDDGDDDFEGDWVEILEGEEDLSDSDESLGDWAKLDTMRSSHPMYFAKKIAEVTSDVPIDYMEQAPAGLGIKGLLRPAFIEERSGIKKHMASHPDNSSNLRKPKKALKDTVENGGSVNGHPHEAASSEENPVSAEDLEGNNGMANGAAFYKLEMVKVQLMSSDQGHPTSVEVEDYKKAIPDAIAHSAAKIIARVNAAGEKTTNALKALCCRSRGLQVEEASLIGIDSLGFDLRVCAGTQVQTLRFAFSSRATSEYSAERQLNDLLFPRSNQKALKVKQVRRKES